MKVLGINGSARKDGNTAMIQLSGQIIEPCKVCWTCGGQKNCVHKKDAFRDIFQKMAEADGVLLGSLVYSANIAANMQAFLERAAVVTDMNRDEDLFKYKVGASVAAVRRGGALQAVDAMNHFFLNHEMFVVGSVYWNMAYLLKGLEERYPFQNQYNRKNHKAAVKMTGKIF